MLTPVFCQIFSNCELLDRVSDQSVTCQHSHMRALLRLICSAPKSTQALQPCVISLLAYMRKLVCDPASSRITTIKTNYTRLKHGG